MTTNLLRREWAGLAKIEATPGTAESLSASDGAIVFMDMPEITRNVAYTAIPAQQGLGWRTGVTGARSGVWTLRHKFYGKGGTGLPDYLALVKACGINFTGGSGAPLKNSTVTNTLGRYIGAGSTARYETLVGAMGNCVISGSAGSQAEFTYTMTGCLPVGTSGSPPTITYPTTTAPRWANAAGFSIGGTEYPVPDFEFDFGNTVILLPDPNTLSGYRCAYIANRAPQIRVKPTSFDFGTLNHLSRYFAGTESQIVITIGTASNNILTITAPKCQLINPPSDDSAVEGVLADSLVFQCNQNSDTEDSEFTLVWS